MASAEWTGVIELGKEELDCRLFSASGKAKPFPLKMIHLKCKTPLASAKKVKPEEEEKEEEVESAEKTALVETREQINCPSCRIALKADEIGRAAETDAGLILLAEEELESLEPKKEKRVRADFVDASDPCIFAIGIGRRLYVFPKPAAVQSYCNIFHILNESKTAGFIPELVIKKIAYPAILQPILIPEAIFGAKRQVLVVDVLKDSEILKDPIDFPDYITEIPLINVWQLAQQIAEAQQRKHSLNPELCVNPKRKRLKELLRKKVRRALQ